jgi:hypothetical protein
MRSPGDFVQYGSYDTAMYNARVALVFIPQDALNGHFTGSSLIEPQMQAVMILEAADKTVTGIRLTITHNTSNISIGFYESQGLLFYRINRV